MKKLIIIGAGGFGREVLGYALDIKKMDACIDWEISGFIDDNNFALDNYKCEYSIVGNLQHHEVSKDNVYICAIGDPKTKLEICSKFLKNGARFINIIHSSSRIGRTCKIGIGVIVCPNVVMTEDVTIGNFVTINCHSNCGHDSFIDNGCTLSVFCDVTGYVKLEEAVFLGSHVAVCPSVTVGNYSTIGAGATIINDIPNNCVAVGIPAKVIKYNK